MLVFLPGLGRAIANAPLDITLAIVYLGVFPAALAYVAFSAVLAHAPASLVTTSLYLIPVVATGIAWVWLREVPSMLTLVGGGIVMAGVLLVVRWGHGGRER
jgi:drug/metabolite transporter (DMT)-like permease